MNSIFGFSSSEKSEGSVQSLWGMTSASASTGNILGDYSLIRSGSYKKLLKAYYAKDSGSTEETPESKAEKINLSEANQDSQKLNTAVSNLMSTEVTEDNREDLKTKLKAVVESYNKLIDSGSEVNDTSVLRNMLWMTRDTGANGAVLSDVGVTIEDGNKLKFDEAKFDKTNLSNIESLIKGVDSVMGRLASRAANIAKLAVNAISDSTASAYTSHGSSYKTSAAGTVIDSST